jgi:hypothetical protein
MAEKWIEDLVRQEGTPSPRSDEMALIEHLLKAGFTVIAFRDKSNVLHVDFLGRKNCWSKS